jgi:hypothetical protein|tara:strand:+ start:1592 stop:1882 length:291 start_codon:yes stop_codon:yes gene_type:complete
MITKDQNDNRINFSIDSLDEIIRAKIKSKKVIESCKTDYQLDVAKRLVGNYLDLTQDMIGASELELDILYKRKEVGDGKFTKRDWNKLIKQLEKDD